MPERDWVGKHKNVHQAMELIHERGDFIIKPQEIANMLEMDVRTVTNQLTCCEIDEFGIFLDTGKKLFITKDRVIKIAKLMNIRMSAQ